MTNYVPTTMTPKQPETARSFVSHAQNFEDVILKRCFPGPKGFYIDAGAHHPVYDSVTYAFYQSGWTGLNLEPSTQYFPLLQRKRPRDINLQVAAADHVGSVTFYELSDSGLSTTNADFAKKSQGQYKKTTRAVPCSTLAALCERHDITQVDFMKIDVEGSEEATLRGFPFDRIRPTVIVVEATEPNSTKPAYHSWEPILLAQRYDMVLDDNLNRFYLRRERSDLRRHFEKPPNVFDNFTKYIPICEFALQLCKPIVRKAMRKTLRNVAAGVRLLKPGRS